MANTPTSSRLPPSLFTGSRRQSDQVQSNVMKELPGVFVLVLGEARPRVSMLQLALAMGV